MKETANGEPGIFTLIDLRNRCSYGMYWVREWSSHYCRPFLECCRLLSLYNTWGMSFENVRCKPTSSSYHLVLVRKTTVDCLACIGTSESEMGVRDVRVHD